MNYPRILLIALILLSACQVKPDENDDTDFLVVKKKELVKLDDQKVPDRLLTLNTEAKIEVMQGSVSGNLFGKFFCDRAEFYIIKNPQNNIFSAKANSIVLYYLDQQLRQTKYALTKDIVTQLVSSLGSFSIVGLDNKNRKIVHSKRIVNKTKNGWTFNSQLDRYELEWTFGDKQIKYRVNPDNHEGQFVYLEKTKDYEKEFKALEKYCI